MDSLEKRTRFATLLAVGTALFIAGVATAGLIDGIALGKDNDAGTQDTRLITTSAGSALDVQQNGTGVAIRGSTGPGPGTAGAFTSTMGTSLTAVVGSQNGFAVYAGNTGPGTGVGGAVRVDGQQNIGLVATSDRTSAVVAAATGTQPAIDARAPSGTGIRASGSGAGAFEDCARLPCAGVSANGIVGVQATTATEGGAGVYAVDQTTGRDAYAVVAEGDAVIRGSVTIGGGCMGCTQLEIARNGSDQVLRQGDAVALLGLERAEDDSTVIIVGPASQGDDVVGVVDRGLTLVVAPDGPVAIRSKWQVGEVAVPAGATLRIVVGGMITLEGALEGLSAGDRLAVGDTPGRLVTSNDGTEPVGRYLGTRSDGRGVLLVDID
jgi:hypothetical protein